MTRRSRPALACTAHISEWVWVAPATICLCDASATEVLNAVATNKSTSRVTNLWIVLRMLRKFSLIRSTTNVSVNSHQWSCIARHQGRSVWYCLKSSAGLSHAIASDIQVWSVGGASPGASMLLIVSAISSGQPSSVLVQHGIFRSRRGRFVSMPPLCERHRPFGLPRPITAPTAAAKRELSLANSMGQLDAGDRDGGVRERLEPSHRRTAQ
jgi:hypothetical protein